MKSLIGFLVLFVGLSLATAPCSDDDCCTGRQNPNIVTGLGYYEFESTCLHGGLNCVGSSGCILCKSQAALTSNQRLCRRFVATTPSPTTTPAPTSPEVTTAPTEIPPISLLTCETETCCEGLQKANPSTGQGYLEYDPTCLNGVINCVEHTSCRLCRSPSAENTLRPVCGRFGTPTPAPDTVVCADEACCEALQDPNLSTGQGFYEYDPDCLSGGFQCVGTTNCKLCRTADASYTLPPICDRFIPTTSPEVAATTPAPTGTIAPEGPTPPSSLLGCDSEECCEGLQRGNPSTGQGYFEYDPTCVNGVINCVEHTNCRLCRTPDAENTLRPVCARFATTAPAGATTAPATVSTTTPSPVISVCSDQACCTAIQHPNPSTGEGYLQYSSTCASKNGLNCVQGTGCQLCSSPAAVNSIRPACQL